MHECPRWQLLADVEHQWVKRASWECIWWVVGHLFVAYTEDRLKPCMTSHFFGIFLLLLCQGRSFVRLKDCFKLIHNPFHWLSHHVGRASSSQDTAVLTMSETLAYSRSFECLSSCVLKIWYCRWGELRRETFQMSFIVSSCKEVKGLSHAFHWVGPHYRLQTRHNTIIHNESIPSWPAPRGTWGSFGRIPVFKYN